MKSKQVESGRWQVREALAEAIRRLSEVRIESARLDAELLLGHCLGVERTTLLAHPEWMLSPAQQHQFQTLLRRRAGREPLAYLTGRRWFFGLEFEITAAVLIPRPETELLVEAAIEWLSQRPQAGCSVIDVGTGSGAIAVSLAAHTPPAVRISATDLSPAALAVARGNAGRLTEPGRITFLEGDLLKATCGRRSPDLPATENSRSAPADQKQFDLILANLPYIADGDRADLMPEVTEHEPELALFSGPDGLDQIKRLLAQAPAHLRPGGAIMLEIGYDQGEQALALADHAFPAAALSLQTDLAGLDRLLIIQTASHL